MGNPGWNHPAFTYKKTNGAVQYGDLRYIRNSIKIKEIT